MTPSGPATASAWGFVDAESDANAPRLHAAHDRGPSHGPSRRLQGQDEFSFSVRPEPYVAEGGGGAATRGGRRKPAGAAVRMPEVLVMPSRPKHLSSADSSQASGLDSLTRGLDSRNMGDGDGHASQYRDPLPSTGSFSHPLETSLETISDVHDKKRLRPGLGTGAGSDSATGGSSDPALMRSRRPGVGSSGARKINSSGSGGGERLFAEALHGGGSRGSSPS